MDPFERWPQLDDLFEEALEQAPDARTAFLDQACRADPALRRELDALLAAYAGSEAFLENPSAWIGDLTPVDRPLVSPDGQQVGPYRLIRELGRGGMGTVYLAERNDGTFDRRVALKLVEQTVAKPAVLQRFRRERQILARLQHPNIARLYDGGLTADGRPYFVMEFVDGLPIDAYCDAHSLSVDDRLDLFQTVCHAVHHAHQNLVVHRDLKPSNILVAEDGSVKLLDFGIAKLLDEKGSPHGMTETVGRPMTPDYASPEQVLGDPITTASDVYQLGLLLYELLTGQRPFRSGRDVARAVARVIREEEPERPSRAVTRFDEDAQETDTRTADTVSQARGTTSERLRRKLAGDLDTIVLKAIRAAPDRRYSSAEQLGDDLRRHLIGLPVRARPDSTRYRVGKFVRRHPFGVTVSAASVALLTSFAATVASQNRQIVRERDRAEEVTAFLVDLFERADPMVNPGDTVTVYDLLDEGTRQIRVRLGDQPEARAAVLTALGRVHESQGLYDESRRLLEEAMDLRQARGDPSDLDRFLITNTLGVVELRQGNLDAADSLIAEAGRLVRTYHPDDAPNNARALNNLGSLRHEQGLLHEAEVAYRAALTLRQNHAPEPDALVAVSLNNVGSVLVDQGDYPGAEPFLLESLAQRRALYGDDHPLVAVALNNLGRLLREQGDLAGAEGRYRESLEIRRRLLGADHPELVTALNNLGTVMRVQRQYAASDSFYREALDLARARLDPTHPLTAGIVNNLAVLRRAQGDFEAAASLYQETLALRRQIYGPEHPRVATVLFNLGALEHRRLRYERADSLFREALDLRRRLLPPEHPRTADALAALGAVQLDRGRLEAAGPLLREALEIRERALPSGHLQTADSQHLLGIYHLRRADFETAEALLTTSHETYLEQAGADHPGTRAQRAQLVALYESWGKPDLADRYR